MISINLEKNFLIWMDFGNAGGGLAGELIEVWYLSGVWLEVLSFIVLAGSFGSFPLNQERLVELEQFIGHCDSAGTKQDKKNSRTSLNSPHCRPGYCGRQ